MASLTYTIEPDEFLGLCALVELDRAVGDGDANAGPGTEAVSKAKALLRTALADKLEAAGLPWARQRKRPGSAPPGPRSSLAPCTDSGAAR